MDHRSTLSNNLSCNQMAQFNQESIRLCVTHYMDITAGYPTRNRQRERRPLSCRREVHRWARTGFLLRHMHTLSYGGTVVWNLLAVSSSTGSLNVLVVTCSPCVRRAMTGTMRLKQESCFVFLGRNQTSRCESSPRVACVLMG